MSEDVLHLTTLLLKLHPEPIENVEPLKHLLEQSVLHPHGEHAHGPCGCHFPCLAHRPQIQLNHKNNELEASTCKLEPISKRQCKLDRVFNMQVSKRQGKYLANGLLVVMSQFLVALPNPMLIVPTSGVVEGQAQHELKD